MNVNIGTNPVRRTVLTGAGFSKNFGGYLANQISDELLSDIDLQKHQCLIELVQKYYNYEEAIGIVRTSAYTQEQQNVFDEAIRRVYEWQNEVITDFGNGSINVHKFRTQAPVRSFFDRLSRFGVNSTSAFNFTLNQDIFFEWLSLHQQGYDQFTKQLGIPGLNNGDWPLPLTPTSQDLRKRILVPDTGVVWDVNARVNLIKLHGSANWDSSNGRLLVVGSDKEALIEHSPLLNTYHQVFRQVCNLDQMKILIIGYGFFDPHINKILAEGIANGLRIYVWERMDRGSWSDKMRNYNMTREELAKVNKPFVEYGEQILGALRGYTNSDMANLLYGDRNSVDRFNPTLDRFLYSD